MTWQFLLAATIVVVTPGTGALYVVSAALTSGLRAGLLAALACTIAVVPHAALAITGLASLLAANPLLFQGITYAGAAFLLWLAWGMWRDASSIGLADLDRARSTGGSPRPLSVVRDAVTVNLLNPKLTLFFVAFLPQFVSASAPGATAALSGLSLVFLTLTFVIYCLYATLADRLRALIATREAVVRRVRRGFALCFAGLGGYVVAATVLA